MKERLTKRLENGGVKIENETQWSVVYPQNYKDYDIDAKALLRLAEYEDAEEQGLIARLPCKVGDMVYIIFSPFGNLDEWEITSIQIFEKNFLFRLGHKGTDDYAAIWDKELGDHAFLTREEAEEKLKELKGVLNE